MRIGITINKLRTDKKIKANSIYKDILSRPAIIKFEKGESDTTAEKFMIILERLNISLEEFEVFHRMNNSSDIDDTFSPNAYKKAFYAHDISQLQYLSEISKVKFEETGLVKYRNNYALINLLISEFNDSYDITEDKAYLQDYLLQCEYWSYYEITLFTNTVSFYDIDFINVTYKQAKRILMTYQGLVRYKNELALLLFNILQLKISTKQVANINYYIDELLVIQEDCLDNMYIQTIIHFYSLLVSIMNGAKNNISEVYRIIETFEFLNMHFKANQCKELLTYVIE